MKTLVILTLTLSLFGCGQGFRAINPSDSPSGGESSDSLGSEDAFFIDESDITEEQLELDLGDKVEDQIEEKTEEQIELPLEEETSNPEEKEESKVEVTEENRIKFVASDSDRAKLLKPTVYYLPSNDVVPFRACKATDTKLLRAKKGKTLVNGKTEFKVCSKFYFAAQMQGSALVRVNNGSQYLINYVGAEDGIPRYTVVDRNICPYGLGVSNLCLQPFISIAADRKLYKAGDVIFVPAVRDAKIVLPDGDLHQGFFIVTDTGAAIVGSGRFDFYTGPMHYSDPKNPFVKLGLQSKLNKAGLTYRRVKRESKTAQVVLEYYKGRQIIPYN